jgi:hypothetical protein
MPYKDKQSEKAKLSHVNRSKKYYEKKRTDILNNNKTDPRRLKSSRINNWKRRGVIGDLHELYDKYIMTDVCECCNNNFKSSSDKCLDHDHITGIFRKIICRSCNNWDNYLKNNIT